MARRTGPTNPQLSNLIVELKKKAIKDASPFWKRLATDLEMPARRSRIVNLSRINRVTKDNELVVVPGKVLGSGMLDHKVTIVAFSFSEGAVEKIKKQNCNTMSINELLEKGIKTSEARIIG